MWGDTGRDRGCLGPLSPIKKFGSIFCCKVIQRQVGCDLNLWELCLWVFQRNQHMNCQHQPCDGADWKVASEAWVWPKATMSCLLQGCFSWKQENFQTEFPKQSDVTPPLLYSLPSPVFLSPGPFAIKCSFPEFPPGSLHLALMSSPYYQPSLVTLFREAPAPPTQHFLSLVPKHACLPYYVLFHDLLLVNYLCPSLERKCKGRDSYPLLFLQSLEWRLGA